MEKFQIRLKKIEGQVRGVNEMIDKGRTEADVLIQLQAIRSAVSSLIIAIAEDKIDSETPENYQKLKSILKKLIK